MSDENVQMKDNDPELLELAKLRVASDQLQVEFNEKLSAYYSVRLGVTEAEEAAFSEEFRKLVQFHGPNVMLIAKTEKGMCFTESLHYLTIKAYQLAFCRKKTQSMSIQILNFK